MNSNVKNHVLSLLFVIVFGVLAFGSIDTDSDTQEIQSQAPSYTLSADQLYREYDANEVAADAKYKGKIVIVSGTIQDIGKDIMDDAYVVIGGDGFLDGVQCTFTKGQQSVVAGLSKGQHVTIKGQVSGKMGNVLVNKASIK